MIHMFDSEIAQKYGILEAVLLNNFQFWIEKNRANEKNFHDGRYWTYNSTKAFHELFPYATKRQIEKALKNLRDQGVLLVGNYNENKYDRTLWYALSDSVESMLPKREMEITEKANGNTPGVTPIPDNNTDKHQTIKTDSKERPAKRFTPPTVFEVADYCRERNNTVNPEKFMAHYETVGWMVGKNHMKDWKAAVRTWEQKERATQNNVTPKQNRPDRLEVHTFVNCSRCDVYKVNVTEFMEYYDHHGWPENWKAKVKEWDKRARGLTR